MKLALAVIAILGFTPGKPDVVFNAVNVLVKREKPSCPGCASGPEVFLTDSDMHAIRLEFIKSQILRKLQLEDTPKVTKLSAKLPDPIKLASQRTTTPQPPMPMKEDDSVAKTNQIILLAVLGGEHEICRVQNRPAACFSFELPRDLIIEDIESTELWIRKRHDFFDNDPHINQTLVYFEIDGGEMNELVRQSTKIDDGWIRLSFNKRLKYWLSKKNYSPQLLILCPSCGNTLPWTPLSMEVNNQPMLVITPSANQKKRSRRNINCSSSVTECCREKLYVSFKEIKWDDWIIYPDGYEAYFCKGSCTGASSASLTSSVHSSLIRRLFQHTKRVDLVQCCAATQHSPMTMIYRSDNQTVSSKTLPNMVVEACGCM